MTGGLSSASDFILGLVKAPRSVDIDLLTGGDGDLGLMELTGLPSETGIFVVTSLSMNLEGNRSLLCLPEEQLLTCNIAYQGF